MDLCVPPVSSHHGSLPGITDELLSIESIRLQGICMLKLIPCNKHTAQYHYLNVDDVRETAEGSGGAERMVLDLLNLLIGLGEKLTAQSSF